MKDEHGEENKWDNSTKKAAEIMQSYLLKNQNENGMAVMPYL